MKPDGGGIRAEAQATPPAALSVFQRYIELPRYLRTVQGSHALAVTLSEVANELGFGRLVIVSGPTVTREVARELSSALPMALASPLCAQDNGQLQVERLAAAPELTRSDAAIAVGGGKTIDVVKSACELVGRPVIAVPTQLTADGIASPVSVIRAHSGEIESRPARLPIGVVVDLDVVARSPIESFRAGLGDLLANPSALRDWALAARAGREPLDDFAALLSQAASDLVYATDVSPLGRGIVEPGFVHRLLQGLVLSGLAMEIAGSSRPCSGSEHLISHALDRLHPGTAHHGEQVAFGSIVCGRLQGVDWRAIKDYLREAGLTRAAAGFGLSKDHVVAAIQAAPTTRPGRYTVLDEVELSDASLRALVGEVLTA